MKSRQGQNWLTVQRAGIILGTLAIVITICGHLIQYKTFSLKDLFINLWANISTELLSIAVTILIIDKLYQRHDEEREKKQLMLQMSSPDESFAQEAIRSLRARGWLTDGSLRGVNLRWANLKKGELWGADLQMADFNQAKLKGARLAKANLFDARNLFDEQLIQARNLRGATMPDGNLYDGRFNLDGDFFLADRDRVNINDPDQMAGFYNVSLEVYLSGQEWAKENLMNAKKQNTPGECVRA